MRKKRSEKQASPKPPKPKDNVAVSGQEGATRDIPKGVPPPDAVAPGHDLTASAFLAHVIWVLGTTAVIWATAIVVGLSTFQLTTLAFLKDLNYSSTVVLGLLLLGVLLLVLHLVLHLYRRHATDGERFPGQIGKLLIPPTLRWVRVVLFVGIVVGPTAVQTFACARMFAALAIVPNSAKADNPDTKRGLQLLTDWGSSKRYEGRRILHGWHWYSWNDDRPNQTKTSTPNGVDAWPGIQPCLYVAGTAALLLSLVWLMFCPLRVRAK